MRILNLCLTEFVGIDQMDLRPGDITLIHGPNNVGKTSVLHALRLLMLGTHDRVARKMDLPKMIRDGADEALLTMQYEHRENVNDIAVKIRASGHHTGIRDGYDLEFAYVLDPHRFAADDVEARKHLLFLLSKKRLSAEDIASALRAEGARGDLVDQLIPMMGAGFAAIHDEAKEKRSEAGGRWRQITGHQRYGKNIAERWTPALADVERPSPMVQGELEERERELETLQARIDRYRAYQERVRQYAEKAEKLQAQVDAAEGSEERVKQHEEDWAVTESELNKLRGKLPDVSGVNIKPCPHCGNYLIVDGLVLTPHDPPKLTEEQEKHIKSDIRMCQKQLAELESKIEDEQKTQRKADSARQTMEQLSIDQACDVSDDELKQATARKAELEPRIEKLKAELDDAIRAERMNKNASETQIAARKAHEEYQGWERIMWLVSPDGIPSQMLADIVAPMNDHLVAAHLMTGWPSVYISESMDIFYGGRPYFLLSESEQWRCDAQITNAITSLAGYNLMVLDRVDILDIANRGLLVEWCFALASEGKQVLLLATLKDRYETEGVTSVWLPS